MKTSLKTGFAQIFSSCPKKMGVSKIFWGGEGGGCSPPPNTPLARTSPLTKLKRISSSSSNYVVLTFEGMKKNIPFLN